MGLSKINRGIEEIVFKMPVSSANLMISPVYTMISSPLIGLSSFVFSGLFDYLQFSKLNKRKNDLLEKKNSLEKMFVQDGDFKKFLKKIAKKNNLKIEDFERIVLDKNFNGKGTSVQKSGYITKVNLEFKNKTISLIHKFSNKKNGEVGDLISKILKKQNFEFVPETYSRFPSLEGSIYEFKVGKTLLEKKEFDKNDLFDNLYLIYGNKSLSNNALKNLEKGKLQKRNLEHLIDLGITNNSFFEDYSSLESVGSSLIHGDLHQGNILLDSENKFGIIDWDNSNYSIPYEDFFNLSLTSGSINDLDYKKDKEIFLERQKNLFPSIEDSQLELVEFNTYFKYLLMFYKAKNKDSSFKEVSKYLLEKSDLSLKKFSEKKKDFQIYENYKNFIKENFKDLSNINYDDRLEFSNYFDKYLNLMGDSNLVDLNFFQDNHFQKRFNTYSRYIQNNNVFKASGLLSSLGVIASSSLLTYLVMNNYPVSSEITNNLSDVSNSLLGVSGLIYLGDNLEKLVSYGDNLINKIKWR